MDDTLPEQALRHYALPALERALESCRRLLAVAHAGADAPLREERLLASRLAPDMLSLAHQVRVLADSARGACALLAGDSGDPDAAHVFNRGDEATLGALDIRFADAIARIDAALACVRALASARRLLHPRDAVAVVRPGNARRFVVEDFVWRYVLPNAGFHAAMVHALLRANGVPVGKADFEGPPAYVLAEEAAR